ncbi:hypothetical protein HDU96_006992 [Phlyctochytrium bullatum]|nr:hypothetical protein HDU96_006992 [Phlyctochytrium bullatum]
MSSTTSAVDPAAAAAASAIDLSQVMVAGNCYSDKRAVGVPIVNPEKYYCPPGTIEPRQCPPMSICPAGSIVPKFYGGILLCIIFDILLTILYWIIRSAGRSKASPIPAKEEKKPAAPAEERAALKKIAPEPPSAAPPEGQPPAPLTAVVIQTDDSSTPYEPPKLSHGRRASIQPSSPLGITSATFIPLAMSHNQLEGMAEEDETEEPTPQAEEKTTAKGSLKRENSKNVKVVIAGEVRALSSIEKTNKMTEVRASAEDLAGLMKGFRSALNDKDDLRIDFTFENLSLALPDGKMILKGVTGAIRSRKLTAIMGPSGAGKTTFMSVLMGKVSRTGGRLFINGEEAEMSKYKKIIGYVPQEDIMLRELTVRENIRHSAVVRLPTQWTGSQVDEFVDNVLEVLNLSHVQQSLIGDETTRGVSGGQRKRVNIGMELASVPLALFLDEPTSGLDSTAALKVAEILKKIAALGLTVVSVIHQPRFEIFQQFDDILLLVPGGKTAYLGPTTNVIEYFERYGFFFDPRANPADILMDILSDKGVNLKKHLTPEDLVGLWESEGRDWLQGKRDEALNMSLDRRASKGRSTTQELEEIIKFRGASFMRQALLCHNRYIVQQYRLISALGLEIGVASLAGGLMGIAVADGAGELFIGVPVAPYQLISPATLQWLIPQLGLLIGISCGLAGAPAGVKVFGEEKSVFWREAAAGHNRLAYFLGKVFASAYRFVLTAFHFSSIFAFLATPQSPFGSLFSNLLLQFYCVYGMSAVVSMMVRRENAALLAVVTSLFAAVFCGYGPTVRAARKWGIEFIWHLSFNRWATEAFFSEELRVFRDVYDVDSAAYHYGFTLNQVPNNLLYMFLIGIGLRVAAYLLMIFLNRDKQK